MYNLKVIKSGDRIEIYKINDYVINQGKKDTSNKVIDDLLKKYPWGTEEDLEQELQGKQSKKDRCRTLTDARNNIVRLIKSNSDMNTFITLTFVKPQDYKDSKKSLDNLFHKLRRDYSDLKYLWVLEYGEKNKRLHYHLLCNVPIAVPLTDTRDGKSEEHKKLEREFAKRYWSYGFVDIRELKQESNTNVALYVSTYIVKSIEDLNLEGYRVYGYSRKTLQKPIEEKIYTKANVEQILSQYKDYEVTFSSSYRIGYSDWKGDHKGIVTYLDLKLKGGGNNENK
jgi:hypothetical protein